MADQTQATLNGILRWAGVQAKHLKVTDCEEYGPCTIRFKKSPTSDPQEKTFEKPAEAMAFINAWVALNSQWAANRHQNSAKLFQPLGSHWIMVDHDRREGIDGLIYHKSEDGWSYTAAGSSRKKIDSATFKKLTDLIGQSEQYAEIQRALKTRQSGLEAIQYLSKLTWKDMGFVLDPAGFVGTVPGLKIEIDPDAPVLPLPFKSVRIQGEPPIEIPLTDPYLRMTWDTYLSQAGLKKHTFRYNEEEMIFTYRYRGLRVFNAKTDAKEIRYRFYSPLGNMVREISYPHPAKSPIGVRLPKKPESTEYTVSIHGQDLKVHGIFPTKWPEDQKREWLIKLGKGLSWLPKSMLGFMLKGSAKEKPLRIVLAPKLQAEKLGWVKRGDNTFANYHFDDNVVWMPLPEINPPPWHTYFHEIAGHAYADYLHSDPMGRAISGMEDFAFREYFIWKLTQVFTPAELKEYREKSLILGQAAEKFDVIATRLQELKQAFDEYSNRIDSGAEVDGYFKLKKEVEAAEVLHKEREAEVVRLREALGPLRKKALTRFVSAYAIEGNSNLMDHARVPDEDFAEVSEVFYDSLTGNENWEDYHEKEPMLYLLGLDYLFHQYGVEKIGNIHRKKVFSRQAFREVLGIDLDKIDISAYREAGLDIELPTYPSAADVEESPPASEDEDPLKRQTGFSMPLGMGYQHLSLQTDSGTIQSEGLFLALQLGYQGRSGGVGTAFGFSHNKIASTPSTPAHSVNSLDGGVYGQVLGDVGPATFFLDPKLGVRWLSKQQEVDISLWLGAAGGIGFMGNGLSIRVHNKTNILDPGQWNEFGAGLMVDIPALVRFSQKEGN